MRTHYLLIYDCQRFLRHITTTVVFFSLAIKANVIPRETKTFAFLVVPFLVLRPQYAKKRAIFLRRQMLFWRYCHHDERESVNSICA